MNFETFKKDFYSRVSDFSLFTCGDFNAIKIVLEGLKVDYVSRGKVASPVIGNLLVYRIRNFLKRQLIRWRKQPVYTPHHLTGFGNIKYIISDDGRFIEDANGLIHSFYFGEIHRVLAGEQVLRVLESVRHKEMKRELDLQILLNTFMHAPFREKEVCLMGQIRITFKQIERSGIFKPTELQNIGFAFQNFFNLYRAWSGLLEYFTPKNLYFICHYHKEGMLYAFREKKINTTELQHGLIATQDIFYHFPPTISAIADKSLFADEIFVYGQYWKDKLIEGKGYHHGQIKIAGYYHTDAFIRSRNLSANLQTFVKEKKVILVTTQTFMHKAFVDYVGWLYGDLEKRFPGYLILVKTHPLEKQEHYASLKQFPGVMVTNEPLGLLFPLAEIHISIYSTTLFDAVRYGVPSYSVYYETYADYISGIISSGIATGIQNRQNPLDLNDPSRLAIKKEHFYAPFNPSLFLK